MAEHGVGQNLPTAAQVGDTGKTLFLVLLYIHLPRALQCAYAPCVVAGHCSSTDVCQKDPFHPVCVSGLRTGAIHDPKRFPVLCDAGEC